MSETSLPRDSRGSYVCQDCWGAQRYFEKEVQTHQIVKLQQKGIIFYEVGAWRGPFAPYWFPRREGREMGGRSIQSPEIEPKRYRFWGKQTDRKRLFSRFYWKNVKSSFSDSHSDTYVHQLIWKFMFWSEFVQDLIRTDMPCPLFRCESNGICEIVGSYCVRYRRRVSACGIWYTSVFCWYQ